MSIPSKKSVAFEIELLPKQPAQIPKSICQKINNAKKTRVDKDNLLKKIDLANQRKKVVVESRILKARNDVTHAKEIAYRAKELQELKNSESLARLELKITQANQQKEVTLEKKTKKLEVYNFHVTRGAFEAIRQSKERSMTQLLAKLEAAEERRRDYERKQLNRLKEHAEHAKLVREKKSVESIAC